MRNCLFRAALAALAVPLAVFAVQPDSRVRTIADPLTPPPNRVGGTDERFAAFVGATVHLDPDTSVSGATLVVHNGMIVSVLRGGAAPVGARVIDARGLHIYPGFVDPFVEVDAARPDPLGKGAHWNYHVMPQRKALDGKGIDEPTAEGLRKLGFVAAGLSPKGGVFRGSGAAVSLAKPDADVAEPRPVVYRGQTFHVVGFEAMGDAPAASDGRWGGYPGSQMGAIALIRQTLLDADWQQSRRANGLDGGSENCLDALAKTTSGPSGAATPPQTPLLFSVSDELETLRAWCIADEFSRAAVIVGNGTEYKRLEPVAARKTPLIVPLNFPEKPRVAGIGESASVELRELMAWEQAPTNPRRLIKAGVEFSLTSGKLRDRSKFRENLRQAIRHGLSERDALAALTVKPATLLGISDRVGTIGPGKAASFIVADGPIFARKTRLLDVYCDGVRHALSAHSSKLEGVYEVVLDPAPAAVALRFINIDGDGGVTVRRAVKDEPVDAAKPDPAQPPDGKPEENAEPANPARPGWKERSVKAKNVVIADDRLSFVYDHDAIGGPQGVFTQSGLVEERDEKGRATLIKGDGLRADGTAFRWSMRRLPESDWIGAWRVSEQESKAKPASDKDQLRIDFTHGPEGLKGKLTFSKAKGEAIVIECEDVRLGRDTLTFRHSLKKLGIEGDSRDELRLDGEPPMIIAEGTLPDGSKHPYKAERWKSDDEEAPLDVPENLTGLPFGPYAREKLPEQFITVVFKDATVWTSGPDGTLGTADVVVQSGKIVAVGKDAGAQYSPGEQAAEGVLVIDCRGKHLTPGLIDCHSHTGISKGVNEGGQAVTAEVRISDVTNPDAISWYRQLAGGVTTVNNLHGSANTIGGQNQVNKVRWGVSRPRDMHFEGAAPGIKFALGENPKWGNGNREGWRYPQTRMGVEAQIRDRFMAAKAYASARAADPSAHRDLELDALAEILAGTRLIHCHSYRQDEILMLGRLASEMGFKIGTYQHILEGYKVPEVVADSGGGSCFSDWWAYKVEVQDAIPQGGPIMHEQGVVVSFNSDSDEMARRMNVEAAKARKYSRLPDGTYTVSEAEALKFVTLNPAKQLKIDDKVGSIEVGKDADIAIWSGNPLSSLSRCERTFVDGRQMFSIEEDAALRKRDSQERQRLIQKALAEKSPTPAAAAASPSGSQPGAGRRRPPNLLHTILHDGQQRRIDRALDMIRRGYSLEDAAKGGVGTCGCDDLDNWSTK